MDSSKERPQEDIAMQELSAPLVEDEHGYVDTCIQSMKVSRDIVMQLPSHNFDGKDDFDDAGSCNTLRCRKSLKRSETRYKTMKMKRVTIRSPSLDDDVEKVYELLTSDPDAEEDEIRSNLREMHQSLTLKRMVKARIDTDSENRNRMQPLDCWSRFCCRVAVAWKKFCYSLKDLSYSMEPWHTNLKKIQGHYGSGIASYFVFLRWLLYLNIFNFVLSFGFIVLPHLIYLSSGKYNASDTDMENVQFTGYDLLTGSGWIGSSAFYYGRYTNETIEVAEGYYYNMPFAYLFTVGIAAMINLIAVAYSVTKSYQANYIDSSDEVKNKVCAKIFCAWDYSIEKQDTAELRHHLIYNELKATLSSELENKQKATFCSVLLKAADCLFVNTFVTCVIAAIGYLIYFILESKAVEVKIRILRKMTLSLTVTSISFFFHFLISHATSLEYYLSKKFQLYLTLCRVAVLRVVILGVLMYFWLVIYVPGPEDTRCYESLLGQEIYRLILVNFVMNLLLCTFCNEFLRNVICRIYHKADKGARMAEFDIAYNTNDLIYYQTLVWVGAFYGPLLPLLLLLVLVVLFYVKMLSLFRNCRPSQKPWSPMEVQTVFLALALFNFLLAAMAIGYTVFSVRPSTTCGPFQNHETMYDIIVDSLEASKESSFVLKIIYDQAGSPGFLLALVIALSTAVYWAKCHASLHQDIAKHVREQLVMESKDKVFLLRLFESAYREHMKSCGFLDSTSASARGDIANKAANACPPNDASPRREVVNENYVDYYRQSMPGNSTGSPAVAKARYDPGYLLADVPANHHGAFPPDSATGSQAPPTPESQRVSSKGVQPQHREGRSPMSRKSAPAKNISTPEGVLPRPAHKQGFQYLVRGEVPQKFTPKYDDS